MQSDYIMKMLSNALQEDQVRAIIVILMLFIMGRVTVELLIPNYHYVFKELISFQVGCCLATIESIIVLLIHIPYSTITITAILFITVLISIFIYVKKNGVKRLKWIGLSCAIVGIIVTIMSFISFPIIVSNDTRRLNEYYGFFIAIEGGLTEGLVMPFNSTGFSVANICAILSVYKIHNVYLVFNILRLCSIAVVYFNVYEICNGHKRGRHFAASVFTILMLSSLPYTIISSYILSNTYMMDMMIVYFAIMNKVSLTDRTDYCDIIQVMILFSIAFARVESIVYVVMMTGTFLPIIKRRRVYLIFYVILGLAEITYFLHSIVYSTNILTEDFLDLKAIIISLISIFGIIIVIALHETKFFRWIYNNIGKVLVVACVAIFLFVVILDPEKSFYTLKVIVSNVSYLGHTGSWGLFPLVVIAIVVLTIYNLFSKNISEFDKLLSLFLFSYIIVSFCICALRKAPLRISVADSGNRMLMQITPLLIMLFAHHIIAVVANKNSLSVK